MPTCCLDFAIISSLRDGSCQRPSDFAHVPRTVPYTVLLLYFATPLTHCPEQPGLLTFGLPDSPTGKRTAGCSAQRSKGGGAGDQPAPGDMSAAEQSAVPGAGSQPARSLSRQGKLPERNGWLFCAAQRSKGGGAGDQPVPGDMSAAEQPAGPCIALSAGCRLAVATRRSLQVCGIVQVNGRATSLMSPGPCPTRSSSFTSLRRSPTALNNQACSLSDCPIHQPARERLAVLRSEVKEEALAISRRRGT